MEGSSFRHTTFVVCENVITEAHHGATEPSDDVLLRISDTFTYKRKNERLRKAAGFSAAAIGLFLIIAVAGAVVAGYQIRRATKAINEAIQAQALADQARLDADKAILEAKNQTEIAGRESKRAEEQTKIANDAYIKVYELSPAQESLEEAFLRLTVAASQNEQQA